MAVAPALSVPGVGESFPARISPRRQPKAVALRLGSQAIWRPKVLTPGINFTGQPSPPPHRPTMAAKSSSRRVCQASASSESLP